jgi:transcriptional antiterminator
MENLLFEKGDFCDKLFNVALKRAESLNFNLSIEVKNELNKFIKIGVNKLSKEQMNLNMLTAAEKNIEEFVDLMGLGIIRSYKRGGKIELRSIQKEPHGEKTLNITNLRFALSNFCPRFPFC